MFSPINNLVYLVRLSNNNLQVFLGRKLHSNKLRLRDYLELLTQISPSKVQVNRSKVQVFLHRRLNRQDYFKMLLANSNKHQVYLEGYPVKPPPKLVFLELLLSRVSHLQGVYSGLNLYSLKLVDY